MDQKEKLLCGERLRSLRISKDMTQEETAERLGISLRYYQMLERGEKVGSVDMLIAVSDIMGCSLDYLLRGRVEETAGPLAERLNGLTSRQRAYAVKLLELWLESQETAEEEN